MCCSMVFKLQLMCNERKLTLFFNCYCNRNLGADAIANCVYILCSAQGDGTRKYNFIETLISINIHSFAHKHLLLVRRGEEEKRVVTTKYCTLMQMRKKEREGILHVHNFSDPDLVYSAEGKSNTHTFITEPLVWTMVKVARESVHIVLKEMRC